MKKITLVTLTITLVLALIASCKTDDGNETTDPVFIVVSEYEFDSQGNQTKQSYYNSSGNLTAYYEKEYDTQGNLTKYSNYNANGELTRYWIYTYKVITLKK
jgi:hypothetical protein